MNIPLPRAGDLLTLTLTELDEDGVAVARLDHPASPARRLRVHVRGAIPGDTVIATVTSRVRQDLFARLTTLVSPSPDRIEPACPHARYAPDTLTCGGCTLQAVAYPAQLELKRARVLRALATHPLPQGSPPADSPSRSTLQPPETSHDFTPTSPHSAPAPAPASHGPSDPTPYSFSTIQPPETSHDLTPVSPHSTPAPAPASHGSSDPIPYSFSTLQPSETSHDLTPTNPHAPPTRAPVPHGSSDPIPSSLPTLQPPETSHDLILTNPHSPPAAAPLRDATVAPTLPAPLTRHHRHKMEFSFAARAAPDLTRPDLAAPGLALGLHPAGFRWEVVPLTQCDLVSPAFSSALPALGRLFSAPERGLLAWDPRHDRGWLRTLTVREAQRGSDRMVELVTSDLDPVPTGSTATPAAALMAALAPEITSLLAEHGANVSSLLWTVHVARRGQPTTFRTTTLAGEATLTESLETPDGRRLAFSIGPRAFFQPHPRAAELLIAEAASRLGPFQRGTLLDLYCGTGTLGLALAPPTARLFGIELVPEAVACARDNAARNHLTHATFFAGDVGTVLDDPTIRATLGSVDAVLLDPPRQGLLPGAMNAIQSIKPTKIIYVSCKPESLARDLRLLVAAGYHLDAPLQPVDLFPQSHHVETIASLTRSAP